MCRKAGLKGGKKEMEKMRIERQQTMQHTRKQHLVPYSHQITLFLELNVAWDSNFLLFQELPKMAAVFYKLSHASSSGGQTSINCPVKVGSKQSKQAATLETVPWCHIVKWDRIGKDESQRGPSNFRPLNSD